MNKIFEKLQRLKRHGNDHAERKGLSSEDCLDIMAKYELTYQLVKNLLETELSHYDEQEDIDRFHMASLSDKDEEFLNLFSNPPMDCAARRCKMSYLRPEYHNRIRAIVNALNMEGVNISSYVDMVLTDHFMRFGEQIDHLIQNCYRETYRQNKQWKPS